MRIIKYVFLYFLLNLPLSIFGQQEITLFSLKNTWQANSLNPAYFPKGKSVLIGLPGVYSNAYTSNIDIKSLKTTTSNGKNLLDVNAIIPNLEERNDLKESLFFETFSLGLNLNKIHLSIGHTFKFNGFVNYPKTLAQLVWQGNSQFIGQDVDISTNLELISYNEFALGLAYDLTPGFTIGGRLKYLSGHEGLSTNEQKQQLSLFTNADAYQLTLNSDFEINATDFINYNGLFDFQADLNFADPFRNGFFGSNSGLAFDFGFEANLGKFQFAGSILDIGQLDWKEGTQNFSLTGSKEFRGLDVLQELLNDTVSIGSVVDTLKALYEPTQTFNTFSSELPLRAYLGANFLLNEKWTLGAVFHLEKHRNNDLIAASIGLQRDLTDWLQVGAAYVYRNEGFNNLGANLHLSAGPLKILFATDNVLAPLNLDKELNANFRLGINLALGKNSAEGYNEIGNQDDFFSGHE